MDDRPNAPQRPAQVGRLQHVAGDGLGRSLPKEALYAGGEIEGADGMPGARKSTDHTAAGPSRFAAVTRITTPPRSPA